MLSEAMHAVGVVCLIAMGGLSVTLIIDEVVPNWSRIVAAYRGFPVPPASPAANDRVRP